MKLLLRDLCLITSLFFIRLASRITWAEMMHKWGRNIEYYELGEYSDEVVTAHKNPTISTEEIGNS
jgi:hypothetical protein